MAYLLGIDQGTTQTTAVVLDEEGVPVASQVAQIRTSFPLPGHVEQDPWHILDSVRQVAIPLLQQYKVAAIGLDNQGETFLLWDRKTGQPLTPAIGWQDKRGLTTCQDLAVTLDAEWLQRKSGLILDTYFSGPKLRYMIDNDQELASAVRSGRALFGTTDSWILWNLSGGRLHVTDPSTASRTLLFDIHRLDWDDKLMAIFGAPRDILPEILPSAGHVGDLDFGSGGRVPLQALLVDQQAALFGQACFHPGEMKCTFGTGAFLLMNTGPQPRRSQHRLLTTVAWQLEEGPVYALDGGIFVAGAAVQWLTETLHLLPDVEASNALAQQSVDPEVVCVTALAGLGAPHWSPEARGAIFGLHRATTAADLVRATLEGIACRACEVVEAMTEDAGQRPIALRVDGGPAANAYLMQSLADLLNLEVQVAATREATACGIANLAGHATFGTTLDELAARWRAERVYQPRITPVERAARLERWQHALAAVREYHHPRPMHTAS